MPGCDNSSAALVFIATSDDGDTILIGCAPMVRRFQIVNDFAPHASLQAGLFIPVEA